MDEAVLIFLNQLIGTYPVLDNFVYFLASYLAYVLVLLAAWAFFRPGDWGLTDRYYILAAGLGAFLSRFGLKEVIVWFYDQPRPFDVLEGVSQLVEQTSFASFPSGHTIFFFSLGTALIFFSYRLGGLILLGGALIGLSRVIAGIHWPSDILGGAVLGFWVGLVVIFIWLRFFDRSELSKQLARLKKYNALCGQKG